MPFTMNQYSYCFNSPILLVDPEGAWPSWSDIGNDIKSGFQWAENAIDTALQRVGNAIHTGVQQAGSTINRGVQKVGNAIDVGVQTVTNKVSGAARWAHDLWINDIYGQDYILYENEIGGMDYEATGHTGGEIFVIKKGKLGEFDSWSLRASITLGRITFGEELSGKGWNPLTWKYSNKLEYTNPETGISYDAGSYLDQEGIGYHYGMSGTTGTLPLPLPDGTQIEDYGYVSWNLTEEVQIITWKQLGGAVAMAAAAALLAVIVADDLVPGLGSLDDGAIPIILYFIQSTGSDLLQSLQKLSPAIAVCGG